MTTAHDARDLLTVLSAPLEGAPPVNNPMADGPGLFQIAQANGEKVVTNVRRLAGSGSAPGRGLINTATVLLGLLDGGLFAISLAAQYQYIFHAKHQSWPAIIEAVALDAGMVIFSLLALGLARGGQSARIERALILACSFGSAGMNYAAADVTSPRSVLAYTMPPVFLAVVTDRVIAVVRRHVLGMEETSAWTVFGRAALAVLHGLGQALLYTLRLAVAPKETLAGFRRLVLQAAPLPPVQTRTDDPYERTDDPYTRTGDRTGREAVVARLADDIRDAIEAGERWQPDYPSLMQATGRRRSWCEKAVRDARTAAFHTPNGDRAEDDARTAGRNPS